MSPFNRSIINGKRTLDDTCIDIHITCNSGHIWRSLVADTKHSNGNKSDPSNTSSNNMSAHVVGQHDSYQQSLKVM